MKILELLLDFSLYVGAEYGRQRAKEYSGSAGGQSSAGLFIYHVAIFQTGHVAR